MIAGRLGSVLIPQFVVVKVENIDLSVGPSKLESKCWTLGLTYTVWVGPFCKFRNHLRQSTLIGAESADKLYPILNYILSMVTVNLFSPDVSLSLLIIRISEDLQFVQDTKK